MGENDMRGVSLQLRDCNSSNLNLNHASANLQVGLQYPLDRHGTVCLVPARHHLCCFTLQPLRQCFVPVLPGMVSSMHQSICSRSRSPFIRTVAPCRIRRKERWWCTPRGQCSCPSPRLLSRGLTPYTTASVLRGFPVDSSRLTCSGLQRRVPGRIQGSTSAIACSWL